MFFFILKNGIDEILLLKLLFCNKLKNKKKLHNVLTYNLGPNFVWCNFSIKLTPTIWKPVH